MLSWVLQRSKVFLVLFILFIIIGVYTFLSLPQREIPEITLNIGTITTVYPGATVDDVERDITNPIEESVMNVEGIEEIVSSSSAGFSSIVLTLEDGANQTQILSDVRQAVSVIATQFPESVNEPKVSNVSGSTPIVSYHIISDDRTNLNGLYEEMMRWQKEVESLRGVDRVVIKGIAENEVVISLDSTLLAEARLTLPEVIEAIEDEFSPSPLGTVETDGQILQLKVDHYRNRTNLESVLVARDEDNNSVYLSDVGTVKIEPKETTDLIAFEDAASISFTAFVQPGEDIPTVDKRVDETVSELAKGLPENAELVSYYSQASVVTEIFEGLFLSLAIAVVVVIFTATLGLTFSGAVAVALAVPISMLMGLIPLPFTGVDLNQISVIGAIIALGILVDDSIVVNDNIQRHYKMGKSALTGAITGVKEVWVSIVTSSLAIVFTFLPLVFLSGANGAFIRALPMVLITTILASTLVALFFVPMLRYLMQQKAKRKMSDAPGLLGKPLNLASDFYANRVLAKTSRRPFLVSFVGLLMTTAILGLVVFTPFEFFPAADREEVTIDVELPIGTPLEETYELMQEMADFIKSDDGVVETSVFSGTGLPNLFNSSLDVSGAFTGQIVVRVDRENQTAQGFINDWTKPLREEFPMATIFLETIEQGPPTGAPVTVTVAGPNIDSLVEWKEELQLEMKAIGAELVLDNMGPAEPAIVYVPDREKLEQYGVTVNQISEQIRIVTGGIPFRTFDDGVMKYNSTLFIDRVEKGQEVNLNEIDIVAQENGVPTLVPLSELVTKERTEQFQRIGHIDGERAIVLRAYPGETEGFKGKVAELVETHRQNLQGNEYSIWLGGENQAQDDFFAEIIILFIIVIFLVYLLLAFQFNSLTMPFLVLVAVYLAIVGAILGLFVTQTPISFLAVMGMVSLTGIVVRNSVVLLDFIEQGRKSGMSIREAVIESGRARLRPILLTAVTSVVALLPIAISGDILFTPLAVTIISGILFSTLLTLVLLPMLYIVFTRFQNKERTE
ncbi:efflux RND transporter permease subunit [Alkalihalobacillus sp. LMS39]|uniref:efflux RND transporter permease subunit n=1 Tax=Alkalihalobacillus sp. LMS39 TaxID=2924032 RepID=UPI001FB48195|nr:efflux RND transporter permease subunit [Alkalihalobacillus sp. LMS39]UOE94614.1 efflux RND transporter permease subunit [Alkalihalobacillus sp. LMS39]